ncbi:hypothetical protein DFA_00590 [Cavenderia fasciculata]|uniref:Uncharacterized protein n=1 Tax=Cavenderia fasciculata TaxID=261658 RepID=F4PSN5_CACFS|nr:hypothetical protein DFA_00590 [Cavenderia fasciculata]EGG20727.1 hypothetical protein DFA_00590 [Cavenderia fasciculata]|eukprot:XP_004358577.1 hypothetical protein DFA_00590 [Cavenderia fasciculata]
MEILSVGWMPPTSLLF